MMMTPEQIVDAFRVMHEQMRASSEAQRVSNEIQQQALQAVMGRVMEQGSLLQQTVEQSRQFMEEESRSRRQHGLIDTRAVQKPQSFSGKEADWPGWSFKFGTWISGQYQHGQEVLDWAASLGETAVDETNLAETNAKYPSAVILNQTLHPVLVSLTNMGTTAFELVKNTKPQMGLDAWRRLSRKFDLNNPTANLRRLRRILQPRQTSLDLLPSAIEQWEQDLSLIHI